MKTSIGKIFKEGILTRNPILVQLLGLCPALAITTSVANALAMGGASSAVLILTSLFVSITRGLIPKRLRVLSYLVVISGLVTAAELLTRAYFPAIDASLGIFIPLIAVNCIILARAEDFASKNGLLPSLADSIATGIGFTLALSCIAFVRELLATGRVFAGLGSAEGVALLGDGYHGASILLLPAGAFLTVGFLCALVQKITSAAKKAKKSTGAKRTDASKEEVLQ